jgi:hypothetical protein
MMAIAKPTLRTYPPKISDQHQSSSILGDSDIEPVPLGDNHSFVTINYFPCACGYKIGRASPRQSGNRW